MTALFWVIKVLTTGMGETTSDYLVHQLVPEVAVVLGGLGFVVAMVLQLRTRGYVAGIYWLAVVMVSIFGTMVADVMHIVVGIPYVVSTIFFSVALVVVFAVWYAVEGTLSIHSIHTRRRELFYWATVLTTFALGTAAGDMTATTLGLGWFAAGVLFAVVISIPAVGYLRFGMDAIVAFWFAYIFTRPLGASFADWFALPPSRGGLGFGTGPVSIALALAIAALVGYLAVTRRDVDDEAAAPLPLTP
ncbi:MAG: hypothetical protein WAN48_01870 [Actinomycetes bacterium]